MRMTRTVSDLNLDWIFVTYSRHKSITFLQSLLFCFRNFSSSAAFWNNPNAIFAAESILVLSIAHTSQLQRLRTRWRNKDFVHSFWRMLRLRRHNQPQKKAPTNAAIIQGIDGWDSSIQDTFRLSIRLLKCVNCRSGFLANPDVNEGFCCKDCKSSYCLFHSPWSIAPLVQSQYGFETMWSTISRLILLVTNQFVAHRLFFCMSISHAL